MKCILQVLSTEQDGNEVRQAQKAWGPRCGLCAGRPGHQVAGQGCPGQHHSVSQSLSMELACEVLGGWLSQGGEGGEDTP